MSSTKLLFETVVNVTRGLLPAASARETNGQAAGKWSAIPIPPPRPRVMGHIRDLVLIAGGQSAP
jgi:hypothetical protein